jgi:hypothetical protein
MQQVDQSTCTDIATHSRVPDMEKVILEKASKLHCSVSRCCKIRDGWSHGKRLLPPQVATQLADKMSGCSNGGPSVFPAALRWHTPANTDVESGAFRMLLNQSNPWKHAWPFYDWFFCHSMFKVYMLDPCWVYVGATWKPFWADVLVNGAYVNIFWSFVDAHFPRYLQDVLHVTHFTAKQTYVVVGRILEPCWGNLKAILGRCVNQGHQGGPCGARLSLCWAYVATLHARCVRYVQGLLHAVHIHCTCTTPTGNRKASNSIARYLYDAL